MSFIEVKNVTKYFDNEAVLKNISIEIQEGEVLGVLGRSGSGKSVLLNMLRGIAEYEPDDDRMAEYYANAIWGIFSNWFIVADTSMSTIDFFNPGDILYGFDFGMDQKDYHRLSADDKANGIRHGDKGAVRCIKN